MAVYRLKEAGQVVTDAVNHAIWPKNRKIGIELLPLPS